MPSATLVAASVLALLTAGHAAGPVVGHAASRPAPRAPSRVAVAADTAADSLPRVAPDAVAAWLAAHPGAVLDVRTPSEFAEGHLAGAVNLDVQAPEFAGRAAALTRGTAYLVYCRTGVRAERAGRHLRGLGHAPLVNAGGFAALEAAGLPVTRPPR